MHFEEINQFLKKIPDTVNWFDWCFLATIIIGAKVGRKHGLTAELGTCLQWAAIVAAGSFLYRPMGNAIVNGWHFSPLFSYTFSYISIGLIVAYLFSVIMKGAGGKFITAEKISGNSDCNLGMIAGTVRFLCILVAILAVMNAREYTAQEVQQAKNYQKQNFDSEFFPTFSSIQAQVFKQSFMGKLVKKRTPFLLISSTRPVSSKPQLKEYSL